MLNVLTLLHTPVWQQLHFENLKPYSGQAFPLPFSGNYRVSSHFCELDSSTWAHYFPLLSDIDLSLLITSSCFVSIGAGGRTPSCVRGTVFYCRHSYVSVHSSVNGYWDCFHLLVTMVNATNLCSFLGDIHKRRIAGLWNNFKNLINCILFSIMAIQFHISTRQWYRS